MAALTLPTASLQRPRKFTSTSLDLYYPPPPIILLVHIGRLREAHIFYLTSLNQHNKPIARHNELLQFRIAIFPIFDPRSSPGVYVVEDVVAPEMTTDDYLGNADTGVGMVFEDFERR
jgi:hypothetical protein